MDEDEDEFDELEYDADDDEPAFDPRKIRWIDPVVIGVQVVEEMGRAVIDGVGDIKRLLVAHANYRNSRDVFAAEAARELEMLTAAESKE